MAQGLPRLDRGETFLAAVGEPADRPRLFEQWIRGDRPEAYVEVLVESAADPKSDRRSEQMPLHFGRSGRATEGDTGRGWGAGGG